MKKREYKKIIKEGTFLAEIDIHLIDTDSDWSPCISIEDVVKIDEVRDALRKGELSIASKYAKIYSLQPLESKCLD